MTRSQPMDDSDPAVAPLGHGVPPLGVSDAHGYSRFVQRLHRRYADVLPWLAPGAPTRESLAAGFSALLQTGLDTSAALRVLRQLTLERLAQLDCAQQVPLGSVTRSMTWLAEVTLDIAWQKVVADLDTLHGAPTKADKQRAQMWIVGMGKLGARELNVSSDIDLIYVYDEDGETLGNSEGRNKISCQEYFTRAVKRMYALIGDTTEHGFVFRVDLACCVPTATPARPWSRSTPSKTICWCTGPRMGALCLVEEPRRRAPSPARRSAAPPRRCAPWCCPSCSAVISTTACSSALRILAPARSENHAAQAQRRPPGARQRRQALARRHPRDRVHRAACLQVVRGGQFPELRTRPTLDALQRVARAGLMPQATADALSAVPTCSCASVEHRIQYLDDQQTHMLPANPRRRPALDRADAWAIRAPVTFLAAAFDARTAKSWRRSSTRLLGGERECKPAATAKGRERRQLPRTRRA
jgi:[glutamine synthetase] adenylyltransferase / [glutamine synthetase]-adenylyl-L-tyrosine phosphorylase